MLEVDLKKYKTNIGQVSIKNADNKEFGLSQM